MKEQETPAEERYGRCKYCRIHLVAESFYSYVSEMPLSLGITVSLSHHTEQQGLQVI